MVLELIADEKIEFDVIRCSGCLYEVAVPEAWPLPYELDRYLCSTCAGEEYLARRLKRLQEAHSQNIDLPPLPEMTIEEIIHFEPPPKKTRKVKESNSKREDQLGLFMSQELIGKRWNRASQAGRENGPLPEGFSCLVCRNNGDCEFCEAYKNDPGVLRCGICEPPDENR